MKRILPLIIALTALFATQSCEQVLKPPLDRKPKADTYFQDLKDIHESRDLDSLAFSKMWAYIEMIDFDSAFSYPSYQAIAGDADNAYDDLVNSLDVSISDFALDDSTDKDTVRFYFSFLLKNNSRDSIFQAYPLIKVFRKNPVSGEDSLIYPAEAMIDASGMAPGESREYLHFPWFSSYLLRGDADDAALIKLFQALDAADLHVVVDMPRIEFSKGRMVWNRWKSFSRASIKIPEGANHTAVSLNTMKSWRLDSGF